MIWFTADTHFGHENILKHCPQRGRCFVNIKEHDDTILEGIASRVKKGDELYILGDFCQKASRAGHYRMRLPKRVHVHLIRGNHDPVSLNQHFKNVWEQCLRRFRVGDKEHQKVYMSHYPHYSWPGSFRGTIHLYGHCHGRAENHLNEIMPGRLSMDVGLDVAHALTHRWEPFSLQDVLRFISRSPALRYQLEEFSL